MPRRSRPSVTTRSEHWLRKLVNEHPVVINHLIADAFAWKDCRIEWKSPVLNDGYAEYFDQSFLDRLEVTDLKVPLAQFWPPSGPRWDGLGRTHDGKLILIEAKAHIDECVDYRSGASSESLARIHARLDEAKRAYHATDVANWHSPFYQMANRLAHLYYLAELNRKDAYLVFLHFVNAPDVVNPVSRQAWEGAIRLARKCLGLKDSRLLRRVADIIVDLDETERR